MTQSLQSTEPLSLWECLQDGTVVSFESDLKARTVAIAVAAEYHWQFHKLPSDTRFRIVSENVHTAEAFDFEPWPDAVEPARETPWEEAQQQRQQNYEKGRLISTDWRSFAKEVESSDDYEIMNAQLQHSLPLAVLQLEIMSAPNSLYRTVRIHAEHFRFYIGDRELSLADIQEFGAAYWKNFSQESIAPSTPNKSA